MTNKRMAVAIWTVSCTAIATIAILISLAPSDGVMKSVMREFFIVMGIAMGAYQFAQTQTDNKRIEHHGD